MSWSEIKKAINSDLTKPLNVLIGEILDNSDTGLPVLKTLLENAAKESNVDEVEGLLKNDSYGLSAIPNMLSNIKPQFQISGFDERLVGEFTSASTLPYDFYKGSAVVFNNEIHILGSYSSSSYYKYHYKWNGSSWISASTLPYNFYYSSAVVYNNEIHILGGYGNSTGHYKWNGASWVSVSTLPYNFYDGSAVVYNNEIHILGCRNYTTRHYKWNGSSWVSVSTLPYDFYDGSAVVYNNEIHILGSNNASDGYTKHYKWNGSLWTSVSTLPYGLFNGCTVIYNNEIHMFGGSSYGTNHYCWNGTNWTQMTALSYSFDAGSVVLYKNRVHLLGSFPTSYRTAHYTYIPAYICTSYLPSGVKIYLVSIPSDNVTVVENCTKQSDGSLLVDSTGTVKFNVTEHKPEYYSIY